MRNVKKIACGKKLSDYKVHENDYQDNATPSNYHNGYCLHTQLINGFHFDILMPIKKSLATDISNEV